MILPVKSICSEWKILIFWVQIPLNPGYRNPMKSLAKSHLGMDSELGTTKTWIVHTKLVGGFKHVSFSIIYGMSSFPLTFILWRLWHHQPEHQWYIPLNIINWFINPINYRYTRYITYKPKLNIIIVGGSMGLSLWPQATAAKEAMASHGGPKWMVYCMGESVFLDDLGVPPF
jgi:hypothetical protein